MSMHTYKIFFLNEITQTEHSFIVDASNQKNAKKAFKDSGKKISSIIMIKKFTSTLPVPKIQGD